MHAIASARSSSSEYTSAFSAAEVASAASVSNRTAGLPNALTCSGVRVMVPSETAGAATVMTAAGHGEAGRKAGTKKAWATGTRS